MEAKEKRPRVEKSREGMILEIIKVCGQNGVARFKMGDIDITFNEMGRPAIADLPKTPLEIIDVPESRDTGLKTFEEKHLDPETRELLRKSQLLASDPVQFEKELIDHMEGVVDEEALDYRVEPVI